MVNPFFQPSLVRTQCATERAILFFLFDMKQKLLLLSFALHYNMYNCLNFVYQIKGVDLYGQPLFSAIVIVIKLSFRPTRR